MKKPWVIPLIILVLFLFAWFFRWDYTATKTFDDGVAKWKKDCWTGQIWIEVYSPQINSEFPMKPYTTSKPYYHRVVLTNAWKAIALLDMIWFVFIIIKGNYKHQKPINISE